MKKAHNSTKFTAALLIFSINARLLEPGAERAAAQALKTLGVTILSNNKRSDCQHIPRIIHQIWIGPNPLPEKFKWMIQTWREKHKTWEYRLWTNSDIVALKMRNKKMFDLAQNWGVKADILRYEILSIYGGIYADIDFECIRPFDQLCEQYEFFGGLVCGCDYQIANGLIGCTPNHPIMEECIRRIGTIKTFGENSGDALLITGPQFLTDVLIYFAKNGGLHSVALPEDYFFPFPAILRGDYWNGHISRDGVMRFVTPNTHAIHYWATSWQS